MSRALNIISITFRLLVFVLLGLFLLLLRRCLLILHILFVFEIVVLEPLEFRIVKASFDMKGQRYVFKNILAQGFVVVLHIEKQGFLIVDVEIVFNLVIQF